jgi:putative PIN family toxin of toxin-antitoxin system
VIRVVVDPGVFVSALIGTRGGPPDVVVRAFVDERIGVVASPSLLAELERVLRRPKFARYVDERTRREFVERVRRHATVVDDPVDAPAVTRDPKDDYLVALALHEGVEAIVSGDRDLLDAGLDTPAVWSPREAANRIVAQEP